MFDPVLGYSLGNAVLVSVHAAALLVCLKEPLDLEGYICISKPNLARTELKKKSEQNLIPRHCQLNGRSQDEVASFKSPQVNSANIIFCAI
jgi:hypothetical protein